MVKSLSVQAQMAQRPGTHVFHVTLGCECYARVTVKETTLNGSKASRSTF
jgi:hypothetical protein